MKISTRLLLVCYLLAAVFAIHITAENSGIYNPKAELDQLTKAQAQFEKQLGGIQLSLKTATDKLKATSKTADKIDILQGEINKQKELVFSSSVTLLPQFNLSSCNCKELTDAQKQDVLVDLNNVRNNVNDLLTDLKSVPECNRTIQMKKDLENQLFFISSIEEILNSKCNKKAILTPTIWQTNLNGPAWILGDQTLDDVVQQYYQRSINYDNITNCGIDKPYFNGTECIACNKPNPIFNMYLAKCVTCGEGLFDSGKRICIGSSGTEVVQGTVVPIIQTNVTCNSGQIFNKTTGACERIPVCTNGSFLNTTINKCVRCHVGFAYNTAAKKCQKIVCMNGNYFNTTTGKCQACPSGTVLNSASETCEKCPKGTVYNSTTSKCDAIATCINSVLNTTTNKCQNCSEGTYFSKATSACAAVQSCKNGTFNTTTEKCDYILCDKTQFFDQTSNKCVYYANCTNSFLNKTTNKCQNCSQGTYFSKSANACATVPPCKNGTFNTASEKCDFIFCNDKTQFFNQTANKCIYYSNCTNSFLNKITNNCDKWVSCSEFLDTNTNQCEPYASCSQNGTWLNTTNNRCYNFVTCSDKEFINKTINKCIPYVVCPAGSTLDKPSNTCIKFVPVECGTSKFFNATSNACEPFVTCNSTTFLNKATNKCDPFKKCSASEWLNTITNSCEPKPTCTGGTVYNSTTNKCDQPVTCTNSFYNKITNKCDPWKICTAAQYLNNATNECIAKPVCAANEILNSTTYKCVPIPTCDKNTQFYDTATNTCVNYVVCAEGTILNKTTNKCVAPQCADDQVYDTTIQKCKNLPIIYKIPSTVTNYLEGQTTLKDYNNYIETQITNNPNAIVRTCNSTFPFSLVTRCLGCNSSMPYFSLDAGSCTNCSTGYQYDPRSARCKLIVYITDTTVPNLYLQGLALADYGNFQMSNVENNPNAIAVVCNSTTPYSVGGKTCINCKDNTKPLFDVVTESCTTCPSGTKYNPKTYDCE